MPAYAVNGGRVETSASSSSEQQPPRRHRHSHSASRPHHPRTTDDEDERPRRSRGGGSTSRPRGEVGGETSRRRESRHRDSSSRPGESRHRDSTSRPRESRRGPAAGTGGSRPRRDSSSRPRRESSSRPRRESSSRPRRESSSRPRTTGGAGESSRPRTSRRERSPTKRAPVVVGGATAEPARAHTYRYEPLRPTVRAVAGDVAARRSEEPRMTYDGTGDSPDARLMGGQAEAEDGDGGGAAVAPATSSRGGRGRRNRNRNRGTMAAGLFGLGAASKASKGKGKRPISLDSTESGDPAAAGGKKRRCGRCFWILLALTVVLLVIIIPVAVVFSKKNKDSSKSSTGKYGENSKLPDESTIPTKWRNTYLDPYTWLDTTDFNLTFTSEMVGGLSIMGLFDDYDDSTQANDNVPALNEAFPYGEKPIRGVNLGGWLIIEPFITPSYFTQSGVVDEWTLSQSLGGATGAKQTIETHYKNWVTEATFKAIRDAGLDHVRIPYGYWAVKTYEGDEWVPNVSWRYLLRAIEWARKYGLRVNLDLHSVPGGANGWNHSGRLGVMNWLSNSTEGRQYGQDTLDIHNSLSTFFAQDRYKNIITMYGLVNEPRMLLLDTDSVITWSEEAYKIIQGNGYKGYIIFGDGFRGLSSWKGAFEGYEQMVLDVHQYVIFDTGLLPKTHTEKIEFACNDWANQMTGSLNKSTGFGPTIVGEWGQADTDCTEYLNNVGVGSRWEGTLDYNGDVVSTPQCAGHANCSCAMPNGSPDDYTDVYRQFLLMFAEAQMNAFEKGWGWLYWTWDTENSTQWSYKKSLAAGIIPQKAYTRSFNCNTDIPDFAALGLAETNAYD